MSTPVRALLQEVADSLNIGQVPLTQLGDMGEARAVLPLSTAEEMARYAELLTPRIREALASNRTLERVLLAMLVALFAVASGLTIAAHIKGWNWADLVTIPGLGATAVWPVRRLTALREENIALGLLPMLLPRLSAEDAGAILRRLLKLDGKGK